MTAGGVHGTVTGTEEQIVTVEIANVKGDRVRIKVDRTKVERRLDSVDKSGS